MPAIGFTSNLYEAQKKKEIEKKKINMNENR